MRAKRTGMSSGAMVGDGASDCALSISATACVFPCSYKSGIQNPDTQANDRKKSRMMWILD